MTQDAARRREENIPAGFVEMVHEIMSDGVNLIDESPEDHEERMVQRTTYYWRSTYGKMYRRGRADAAASAPEPSTAQARVIEAAKALYENLRYGPAIASQLRDPPRVADVADVMRAVAALEADGAKGGEA